MPSTDIDIVDADGHVSEPMDLWDRNLDQATADRAMPRLADVLGGNMIWGSDYPHFDGEGPGEALENLRLVPEETRRGIMSGNAARLYRLPLD